MPREDTQWKPGQSGNPSGRPKNTLKDYVREKFQKMTFEEKEEFLKKVQPDVIWKMGEGNPAQENDITSAGEKIEFGQSFTAQEIALLKAKVKNKQVNDKS